MKFSQIIGALALGATAIHALPVEEASDAVDIAEFSEGLEDRDVDFYEVEGDIEARDVDPDFYEVEGIDDEAEAEGDIDARDVEARANLPGLNASQSKYARAIIAQAKKDKVGAHGCQAGIATAMVESTLVMYANKKVPESMKLPHDRVGSDHDSVGLFQQRASIYKNVKCSMDADCSAGQFFDEMKRVKGWKNIAVGTLCQKVQRSAYPDRYAKQVGLATKVCKAGGL